MTNDRIESQIEKANLLEVKIFQKLNEEINSPAAWAAAKAAAQAEKDHAEAVRRTAIWARANGKTGKSGANSRKRRIQVEMSNIARERHEARN